MTLDENEARRLHAAYCYTIDNDQPEAFGELFATDGALHVSADRVFVGRDALTAFAKAAPAGVHVSGQLVVVDGATTHAPWVFTSASSGQVLSGYYTDRFARDEDGRLVFAERSIKMIVTSRSHAGAN